MPGARWRTTKRRFGVLAGCAAGILLAGIVCLSVSFEDSYAREHFTWSQCLSSPNTYPASFYCYTFYEEFAGIVLLSVGGLLSTAAACYFFIKLRNKLACPKCGRACYAADFCPHCHTELWLHPVTCAKCGRHYPASEKTVRCASCGSAVDKAVSIPAVTTEEPKQTEAKAADATSSPNEHRLCADADSCQILRACLCQFLFVVPVCCCMIQFDLGSMKTRFGAVLGWASSVTAAGFIMLTIAEVAVNTPCEGYPDACVKFQNIYMLLQYFGTIVLCIGGVFLLGLLVFYCVKLRGGVSCPKCDRLNFNSDYCTGCAHPLKASQPLTAAELCC